MRIFLEHEWEALINFFFLSSPFFLVGATSGDWKHFFWRFWRLRLVGVATPEIWGLHLRFRLVFGKAKGHSKLQAELTTGRARAYLDLFLIQLLAGKTFFTKHLVDGKKLWWYFFTGWGSTFFQNFARWTSQEESSSFATSAWIPSWKTMAQIAYKTQSFWLHPFLKY